MPKPSFESILSEFSGATAQGEFRRASDLLGELRTNFEERHAELPTDDRRALLQEILTTLDRNRRETLARRAHLSQTLRSLPGPNPYLQSHDSSSSWNLHG